MSDSLQPAPISAEWRRLGRCLQSSGVCHSCRDHGRNAFMFRRAAAQIGDSAAMRLMWSTYRHKLSGNVISLLLICRLAYDGQMHGVSADPNGRFARLAVQMRKPLLRWILAHTLGAQDGSEGQLPIGTVAPWSGICWARISLHYKFIFMRNPKTGGTTIEKALRGSVKHCDPALMTKPEVRSHRKSTDYMCPLQLCSQPYAARISRSKVTGQTCCCDALQLPICACHRVINMHCMVARDCRASGACGQRTPSIRQAARPSLGTRAGTRSGCSSLCSCRSGTHGTGQAVLLTTCRHTQQTGLARCACSLDASTR